MRDLSKLDWKPVDRPDAMAAYEAVDKKGIGYCLCRNVHRPELMFAIGDGLRVPPGWYTDKNGSIEKVG